MICHLLPFAKVVEHELDMFSLQTPKLLFILSHDHSYTVKQIPFMQESMAASRRGIKYYGSPWTPPFWMKTNQDFHGAGQIIGKPGEEYFKTWADYFVR